MTVRAFEVAFAGALLLYVSYAQFSLGYTRVGAVIGSNPIAGVLVHVALILAIVYRDRLVGWTIQQLTHFDELVTRISVIGITWFIILYRLGMFSGILPRLFQNVFDPGFTSGSV